MSLGAVTVSALENVVNELGSRARLIAVSKLQPAAAVRALFSRGQTVFAENYAQEALSKMLELSDLDLEWHFIGHLQRNKVKQVVGKFTLLQGVDREEVVTEIQKTAARMGLTQKVLLEVNLSGEETKSGFRITDDLASFVSLAKKMETENPNVEISGLMTMPPLFDDPEKVRPFFRSLRSLRDLIQKEVPTCNELSMGTSSDYKIALDEGATMVRLGTILFGQRPKGA